MSKYANFQSRFRDFNSHSEHLRLLCLYKAINDARQQMPASSFPSLGFSVGSSSIF